MAVSKNKLLNSLLPRIGFGWFLYLLIWPFGALITSLQQFRRPVAKTVFWLFCVYFGFSFVVPKDIAGSADSARYATQLIEMHSKTVSFENLVFALYNPALGFVDIYQPLSTWIVSIFTDDPKWLFALFGAVFGFFYAQNIWLLLKRVNIKVGFVLFLFMLGFALTNPIWNINGVRMWTAAQVFMYGVLLYFLEEKKVRGIIWISISILFHFSFLFPVSLFFAFIFIPDYLLVYFIFYLLTTLVKEINLIAVRDSLSFLPEVFQPRVDIYTNQDYAVSLKESASQLAWHVRFAQIAGRIVIYSWVISAFITQRYWQPYTQKIYKRLFAFALFIAGFANIASLVPSGGRFLTIANGLFYAVFVLILIQPALASKVRYVKTLTVPLLLFSLIFSIRVGFDYMSFFTIIGNPLLVLTGIEQTPLIEFVKDLF